MAETSYAEWRSNAQASDQSRGLERWKHTDHSRNYDYQVIRRRHDELVDVLEAEDPRQLLFYLNEGIHGNMGGMGSPALYTKASLGTKKLIEDYTATLTKALYQLESFDEKDVPFVVKLETLRRTSLCFGRSALMLSGAGSLGPFHLGVLKALIEQDLLPTVISGSSAGSIAAALVGSRTEAELAAEFETGSYIDSTEAPNGSSTEQISEAGLRELVVASIPDVTFAEAFEISGKHINISVAPSDVQQRSRLLNATTSPNALIREAVMASCAIPGVFPAVTLMARDSQGLRRPYVPSRRWIDGSISDDLPAKRLARLYAVNHFISSQANPLVLWSLTSPDSRSPFARGATIFQSAQREWYRALFPYAMESVRAFYPLNILTRYLFSLMTQEYTADITISPTRRYSPAMLLKTLSADEVADLVTAGEQATWPRIEQIRTTTAVSRCLNEILSRMDQRLLTATHHPL